MSTAGPLSDRPKKDLVDLARNQGIRGWESMTKDELVRAIHRANTKPKTSTPASKPTAKSPTSSAKPLPKPAAKTPPKPTDKPPSIPLPNQRPAAKSAAKVTKPAKPGLNGTHPPVKPADHVGGVTKPATPQNSAKPPGTTPTKVAGASTTSQPSPAGAKPVAPKPPILPALPLIPIGKDLSSGKVALSGPAKDRIFLMVPDPYWLHATWELTHQSVQRAEAALKQDWYGAKPIIRLFDVTSTDTTSTSETPVRDIVVHGGCNNWYIDIPQPPRQYRADIGYVSRRGEFFVLARSNVATPPKAGSTEAIDLGWAEMDTKKAERIMAMSSGFESAGHPELKELFEERLRRPMGAPKETGFGTGAALPGSLKKFFFEIDAELIVYGKTDPSAHVTLQNEPVKLRPDGTFTMLFSLPDSRQIIPAVATSIDGVEERTIVLAVERNTKHLDPMIHDQMNES